MVASYTQAPSPEEIAKRKRALLAANASAVEGVEIEVPRVAYQARMLLTRRDDNEERKWMDASGERNLLYVRDALIDREEVRKARKERKQEARRQADDASGAG